MKKIKFEWIAIFLLTIILLILGLKVTNSETLLIDKIGYEFISKHLISDNMTPIVKIITQLGGATFLIILTLILIIMIKNKKIKKIILINLVSATILNLLIKYIIQRPRPIETMIIEESGYSFPSGHSMVSMAFYGFLIYLINKNIKNRYVKIILTIFLIFLILSIGISRIYLGVHYTSDVIAGFITGIVYIFFMIKLCEKHPVIYPEN